MNYEITSDGPQNSGSNLVYDIADGEFCFPDSVELLANVQEILKVMNETEMIKLKKNDVKQYEMIMKSKFPQFSDRYIAIFDKIISGEDLTMLFTMLATLDRIKSGELTQEQGEKCVGEILNKKYVYPKIKPNKRK